MKAILEYDLDDTCDRKSHLRALKATDAYLLLHDIFRVTFRNVLKYEVLDGKTINDDQYEVLEKLIDSCYVLLEDYNINLDDLE